jgi:hypothetical protein
MTELLIWVWWPHKSPELSPCDFYLWRKLKKCCVCQQSTWLWTSKTEYSLRNLTFSNINCNKLPKMCLKNSGMTAKGRRSEHHQYWWVQYYYIWLIINKQTMFYWFQMFEGVILGRWPITFTRSCWWKIRMQSTCALNPRHTSIQRRWQLIAECIKLLT